MGAASDAAAQVNVILSCPSYDPMTGQGNDPAAPQDPQAVPMDVSGSGPILCQILYGNSTGAPLNNVRFVLRAAPLMIPYADPMVLPGGDPMLSVLYPTQDALYQTGFAPALNLGQAGFPAGVWDAAAGSYTWTLPSIAIGQTGELRVAAYSPNIRAGVVYDLRLEVQAGGQPITRTSRFHIPASKLQTPTPQVTLPTQTARGTSPRPGSLAGRATVDLPHYAGTNTRSIDYDQEYIVYLPWLDLATNTVRVDGYTQGNPQHQRLHNTSQLSAQALLFPLSFTQNDDRAFYAFGPGQSGSPASGPNQGRVLRYDAATNTLRLRFGRSGLLQPVISWRAPLIDLPLSTITTLPTRVCHRSHNSATQFPAQPERCSTANTTLVNDESGGAPNLSFELNANQPSTEAGALLPYGAFTMRLRGSYSSSRPATNARVTMQLPGDSQRRARFIAARNVSGAIRLLPESRPFSSADAIYVSTQPASYGNEANLQNRVVPASTGAAWRRCDDAIAAEPAGLRCTAAHLMAIGVNPADVTELRFDVATLDGYSALGTPSFEVDAALDGTARSSINGANAAGADMTNASVGAKISVLHTRPNDVTADFTAVGWAEVQGGSVLTFYNLQPTSSVQTTEVRHPWGIHLRQRGVGPVNAPLVLRLKFPPTGYEIDNTNLFPGEPYRPQVQANVHTDQIAAPESMTRVTVPTSDYDATWDALTDTLTVTLNLASFGGYMNGNLEPGVRPLNVPADLFINIDGFVRIGAPRQMPMVSASVTAEVTRGDGTLATETILPPYLPRMNVTSVAPALSLSGLASPDPTPGYGPVTLEYTLRNAAYQANGARIPNGATGSARSVALYQRITRDGDHGLTARSVFDSASSPDAAAIWVRTTEPMMGQKGDASSLTAMNGWVLCAMAGAPCSAAALAAAGVSPAAVRWVAFDLGEVLVTDAQPRGVAPRGATPRVELPYTAQVVVLEDGSPQDAILRSGAELLSQDTAPVATAEMELDVVVNAACDTRDATVGPNAPELCDGIDNDCDGQTDEDFPTLGTLCEAGTGACRNEAPIICSADRLGVVCSAVAGQPQGPELCDGMDNTCDEVVDEGFVGVGEPCVVDGGGGCMVQGAGACSADGAGVVCVPTQPGDMDRDGRLDVCDCAPGDNTRFTMTPGAESSCDVDGDGACAGDIIGANPALCLVVGDCDDDDGARYPSGQELCDGIDNNCDGQADEGFPMLGARCEAGVGACRVEGVIACSPQGSGASCDAQAGAPSEEVCDEVDNDCDGEVDEREDGSSLCDPLPPTSYDVSGDGLVSCQSVPARPARSLGWLGLVGLLVCARARRARGLKGVRG